MNYIKKFFNPVEPKATYDLISQECLSHQTNAPSPFKFNISKSFSNFHLSNLSILSPNPFYQFSSFFSSSNSILNFCIDKNKNSQLQFTKQKKNFIFKYTTVLSNETFTSLELDIRNKTNNLSIKNVHPAIKNVNSLFVLNFLQSINKNLSLGSELIYDKKKIGMSYLCRLENEKNVFVFNVQQKSFFNLSYYKKINEILSLALESNLDDRNLGGKIGVKVKSKKAEVKMEIDSEMKSRINYEENVYEGLKINFDGEYDHKLNKFNYGIGFSFDN
ncbi:hypothetical protein GVAV_001187 [Gurleya vavrai]